MEIIFEKCDLLPKLAWIAISCKGIDKVLVFHGPCVETYDNFCIAGVWDGDFKSGDFDKTDVVAGTGIRLRGDKVFFVTPGHTIDRIIYYNKGEYTFLSNSLTAIISVTGVTLIKEHDYQRDLETITKGIYKYKKDIPVKEGYIHLVHYNNLMYDGKVFQEINKPNSAPHFKTFQDYHDFLLSTGDRISKNAKDPARKSNITTISTVSSGYDSAMATVIAKHMGAVKSVTVKNANSWLLGRSDSGEKVPKAIGLKCEAYNMIKENYEDEEIIWASMGECGDLNISIFDFPKPVCLMITAYHGDMVWERTPWDLTEPLNRHDTSASGLSEFALHHGVINCSIAFWGIQHGGEIQNLSKLDEMKPWTLFNDYDRPIVRRIVEGAGVPRGDFAARKTTSGRGSWVPNPTPYSKNLKADYINYVEKMGCKLPKLYLIILWYITNLIEWHIMRRIEEFFHLKPLPRIADWDPCKERWLFFHWATDKVKIKYKDASEYINREIPARFLAG